MSINIRVVTRVRPNLSHESSKLAVSVATPSSVSVTMPKVKARERQEQSSNPYLKREQTSHGELMSPSKHKKKAANKRAEKFVKKTFEFDTVLDQTTSQAEVFKQSQMQQLVESAVLQGYHGTVFAYGQTGSGKTYTMSGIEEKFSSDAPAILQDGQVAETDGIIPRSLLHLFDVIQRNTTPNITYKVTSSFLEIYNEQVIDLLGDEPDRKQKLALRQTNNHKGFYIPNLTRLEVTEAEEVLAVASEGHKNRKVASHELNTDSSRSHAVFQIYVETWEGSKLKRKGRINFVDLAGSENLKQSKSKGMHVKETGSINKSLFALGSVISALCDIATGKKTKKAHVPYRDSVLTKLLMDALSGTGMTTMIACVSPLERHGDETLRTLSYATRARSIMTTPTTIISGNQGRADRMQRELKALRTRTKVLEAYILSAGLPLPEESAGPSSFREHPNQLQQQQQQQQQPPHAAVYAWRGSTPASARDVHSSHAMSVSSVESDLFYPQNQGRQNQTPVKTSHAYRPYSNAGAGEHRQTPLTAGGSVDLQAENTQLKRKLQNLENLFLKRRPSNANSNSNSSSSSSSSTSAAMSREASYSNNNNYQNNNHNHSNSNSSSRSLYDSSHERRRPSYNHTSSNSNSSSSSSSSNSSYNNHNQMPLFPKKSGNANNSNSSNSSSGHLQSPHNLPPRAQQQQQHHHHQQHQQQHGYRQKPKARRHSPTLGGYGNNSGSRDLLMSTFDRGFEAELSSLDAQIALISLEKDKITDRLLTPNDTTNNNNNNSSSSSSSSGSSNSHSNGKNQRRRGAERRGGNPAAKKAPLNVPSSQRKRKSVRRSASAAFL